MLKPQVRSLVPNVGVCSYSALTCGNVSRVKAVRIDLTPAHHDHMSRYVCIGSYVRVGGRV